MMMICACSMYTGVLTHIFLLSMFLNSFNIGLLAVFISVCACITNNIELYAYAMQRNTIIYCKIH